MPSKAVVRIDSINQHTAQKYLLVRWPCEEETFCFVPPPRMGIDVSYVAAVDQMLYAILHGISPKIARGEPFNLVA